MNHKPPRPDTDPDGGLMLYSNLFQAHLKNCAEIGTDLSIYVA